MVVSLSPTTTKGLVLVRVMIRRLVGALVGVAPPHGGPTTLHAGAPGRAMTRERGGGFRPDIDGLRGVAILLVVAYHVRTLGMTGGFIGVDVFFVISGYLITGKLLDEVLTTSSVRLRSFWAGRVRRLVPALAVMVGATLALSLLVLSPLEWGAVARDGAASVTYVSNLVFARQATNYFAADVTSSLFLHTWSLSVEEQFYLVWPVLVLVLGRLVRRRERDHRLMAYAFVLTALGIVSFALAVALTARGTPLSFFGLPTRAWEFSAGGLLACLARRATPARIRFPAPIALGGLGLILGSAFVLSDVTPYPGVATLVPVLGTLAVMYAGASSDRSPVAVVLSTAPAQWLGRVSYSWYLWHWPLILLAVAFLDDDTVSTRAVGVIAALAVATAGLWLVENPIRFSARLIARPAQTFAVGAAFTVVVLALAFGVRADANHELADPFFQRLTAATANAAVVNNEAGCDAQRSRDGIAFCQYGNPSSATTIMLTGDSHAAHWIPAFAQAATPLGVRLIVHTRGGCPSIDVRIATSTTRLVPSEACVRFRADAQRLMAEFDPAVVILSNANFVGRILDDQNARPDELAQLELWRRGLVSTVAQLQKDGRRVGLILENPTLSGDPNTCIARHRAVAPCTPTRGEAVGGIEVFNEMERTVAAQAGGMPTFDVVSTLCDAERCELEHEGQLVYQDGGHLTEGFVVSQVPAVIAFVQAVEAHP
jgi:peptidoglycan/LPS O-acetylase OafA/YrhL